MHKSVFFCYYNLFSVTKLYLMLLIDANKVICMLLCCDVFMCNNRQPVIKTFYEIVTPSRNNKIGIMQHILVFQQLLQIRLHLENGKSSLPQIKL